MIEIKPININFDEIEFNKFQKKLGVTLPNEYIEFLKEKNGGIPESNIFELSNEEIESFSVTDFFGINQKKLMI
ncbi:MAG: hypothetical protein ACFWT6_09585 [Virgibacillus proomii]